MVLWIYAHSAIDLTDGYSCNRWAEKVMIAHHWIPDILFWSVVQQLNVTLPCNIRKLESIYASSFEPCNNA